MNPFAALPNLVRLSLSLLPDSRIFGQITEKRPQKMAGKNWRPKNSKIWQKVAEKRPENIFYNYLDEKSYNYL
jgi:hypothetical protein